MNSKALDWIKSIPVVWVATGALGGALVFGGLAARQFDEQLALPARVAALEEWRTGLDPVLLLLPAQVAEIATWRRSEADPALRFLVCSERARQREANPAPCDIILQPLVPR